MKAYNFNKSKVFGFALLIFSLSACSNQQIQTETKQLAVDLPARIPAGVVRYCWEEPIVQLEPNGPGLDAEERWYHPSYLAVREARDGKWVPCKPVPSEVKGK